MTSARTAGAHRLFAPLALALLGLAAIAPGVRAMPRARAALPLTVALTSDPALTLDGNTPATTGPHAAYVSFLVTNTSGASVPNLTATLAMPVGSVALGGGQAAAQFIGTLAAGQSRTLFWFITYGTAAGISTPLTVNVSDGAAGTASGAATVQTTSMLPAVTGGVVTSASIGAGATVGQLVNLDVSYRFAGWKKRDSFNLQPAGNPTFAGGCFQLVSTLVLSAEASLSSVIVPGTVNETYFVAGAKSSGTSPWNVAMRYVFRYRCAGTTATPLPYSNDGAGGGMEYASNYGTASATPNPFPAAPSTGVSFTLTKTASAAQLPAGGTETYTVSLRNNSAFDVTVDEIRDVLPATVTYAGLAATSGVTAANSSSTPAVGATGAMAWRSIPGSSYAIGAGATLSLVYTASIPSSAGEYLNSASAFVGTTSLGAASATVTVGTADLAVYKTGPPTRAKADTVRYAVTVRNAGPSTAYQVIVRDTLPAGASFVRATNGGTQGSGVVTWPAVASLAVGGSIVDSVLIIAPDLVTTIVNRGAAASASYDPNPLDNNGSADTSKVSTVLTSPVSVLPKGPATPTRLAPNPLAASPRYWQSFTVSNLSVFAGSYNLIAARAGLPAFLQVDSLTGPGITSRVRQDSAVVTLAPNSTSTYLVWYTVPAGDTVTNTEILRARSTMAAGPSDTGWVQLRRSIPALTLGKTVTPTGVLAPGTDLLYTMKFRNTGEYDASAVVVSDKVPPGVWFKVASAASNLPAGITATISYSSDAGATWTYVPVTGGCSAPAGYDSCVNEVRWTLGAPLPPSASTSSVSFEARIR